MSLQQFITNKIINRVKSMGKLSSTEPKKSRFVGLISVFGVLYTLLLYIPNKLSIIGENRFAAAVYAQQQQAAAVATDPLSSSLQIAQSKVKAATAPGAWGHGVPSLHNLSNQDLLMILGITSIGCIAAYFIARIILSRAKEKEGQEKSKVAMYQQ